MMMMMMMMMMIIVMMIRMMVRMMIMMVRMVMMMMIMVIITKINLDSKVKEVYRVYNANGNMCISHILSLQDCILHILDDNYITMTVVTSNQDEGHPTTRRE